ncbi:MAG: hypothetical protein JNL32_12475 [Candidatus Kapabacteria bacterium]|nr:hypothetical protein [Candidatus Kapabacteria bacterium]
MEIKMIRLFTFAFIITIFSVATYSQQYGTVSAVKINLRGTPATTGVVMTTVNRGIAFEVIKDSAPWYLIQTATHVGWAHGNGIDLYVQSGSRTVYEPIEPRTPQRTTKSVTSSESLFEKEYVGGTETSLKIINATDRLLTFVFGGVKYTIQSGDSTEIDFEKGRYEYNVSASGVRGMSGVEEFSGGYNYSWRFTIVTVRR